MYIQLTLISGVHCLCPPPRPGRHPKDRDPYQDCGEHGVHQTDTDGRGHGAPEGGRQELPSVQGRVLSAQWVDVGGSLGRSCR